MGSISYGCQNLNLSSAFQYVNLILFIISIIVQIGIKIRKKTIKCLRFPQSQKNQPRQYNFVIIIELNSRITVLVVDFIFSNKVAGRKHKTVQFSCKVCGKFLTDTKKFRQNHPLEHAMRRGGRGERIVDLRG